MPSFPLSASPAFDLPLPQEPVDSADEKAMDGKYLEQSREEMLKAVDENPVREEDQHDLRAVAALTEAVAELSDRVIRLETGPTETVDELTPFDVMLPESEATERQTT